MLYSKIALLITVSLLGACASSPSYVAADSATDYGHHSRKIAENRYRVNFNGKDRSDLQDTRDFALLRAAELTLAEGYDWFEVVDRETATTEKSAQPEFGFGYERAYYVERNCGVLTCSRTVRPAGYSSLRFDNRRPDVRHSHSIEIVMGQGEIPEGGKHYDARQVVKAIYHSM